MIKYCGRIPTRFGIAVMLFTACMITYTLRVNMSINIVAMVQPSMTSSGQLHEPECGRMNEENYTSSAIVPSVPDYGIRYNWDQPTQGLILGSYFWGYILTCIPGGLLAERFGPSKTVLWSGVIASALTLLTPLAASFHWSVVAILRFLIGFIGGVVFPSTHCLISHWAPPTEKGKFVGSLLGGTFGTVVTWSTLGTIIEAWGWSSSFYLVGSVCLLWCLLWWIMVFDDPATHPRISEEEKIYIIKSLGDSVKKTKDYPPYRRIFTSIPFWALIILHFGNGWGLYLILSGGPKFMSEVLGFNLGHSGILASLPYLARMVCGFIFGEVGDILRRKEYMTVTFIRKFFVTFSHFIPALMLFGLMLVGCDHILAVLFITLSLGVNGSSTLTNLQNSQDLAPNYAGTLYGIINCVGSFAGFLTPMLTGYITSENSGLREWHENFLIGAIIYISSGIVFCFFGSGNVQPWNNDDVCVGVDNVAFDGEHPSKNTKF